MVTLRRISSVIIFALIIVALSTAVSNAQGLKIGFVKDDVILQRFSAWQRAQEQFELEYNAWEQEAISKQQEIQQLLEEYDKQKLILSEEKRKEKEASIQAKRDALDAYTRQIFGPGGTAELKNDQLIKPLLEKLKTSIEAVAVEGDYDVIFSGQSGLGYIKESYDVTEKVLEYLEKEEQ